MAGKNEVAEKFIFDVLRPDTDDQSRQKAYSDWSTRYDQDLADVEYSGPNKIARAVSSFFPSSPDTVRILDIGAGTGLVADELFKYGFNDIDALEPNNEMLDVAKQKKLYKNYFIEFVPEQGTASIADNTYDVITCCGSFGNGHLPCNSVNEMIRMAKSDGLIVIATNPEHFVKVAAYQNRLKALMNDSEKEGRWQKLKEEVFPNYIQGKDGMLLIFRVI